MTDRSDSQEDAMTRKKLMVRLDCALSTVSKMQSEGCPHFMIGTSPRFMWSEVLPWLRVNGYRLKGMSKKEEVEL
jgi:hypothetical protein